MLIVKPSYPSSILATALLLLTSENLSAAAGPSRLAPKPRATSVDIATTGGADTGSEALATASVAVSSELDMATVHLFSGGMTFKSFGKTSGINVMLSSSLPVTKTVASKDNNYNDAQLMMPAGGIVNLMFNPFTTVNVNNFSDINAGEAKGGLTFGRGNIGDRLYFSARGDNNEILTALKDPAVAFYLTSGLGPKLINRFAEGTDDAKADSYGIAGYSYLGIGLDGGILGPKTANDDNDPSGNLRIETFLSASWADRTSLGRMYPQAANADEIVTAWGGNAAVVITGKLQVEVQWAIPFGDSRKHMGKVVFLVLSLSR